MPFRYRFFPSHNPPTANPLGEFLSYTHIYTHTRHRDGIGQIFRSAENADFLTHNELMRIVFYSLVSHLKSHK